MPEIADNNDKKLRYAIFGTSFISHTMAEAIKTSDNGQLYCVAGRHQGRLQSFAEKYGIKPYNYEEALMDAAVDVVYIGLPTIMHGDFTEKCARAGKHILVEKSFTLNSAEAERAIEVLQRHRVFCMEAQMYRCHPLMTRLVSFVKDRHLGKMLSIKASFDAMIIDFFNRAAGGAILDLGCYPISMMRLVAGEPISMTGESELVQPHKQDDNVFDRHSTAKVLLPDGVTAEISACNDAAHCWSFTIVFEDGTVGVTDLWAADVQDSLVVTRTDNSEGKGDTQTTDAHVEIITAPLPGGKNFYTLQIDTVNRHITEGALQATAPAMDWEDSRLNMRALDMWRHAVGLSYPVDGNMFSK